MKKEFIAGKTVFYLKGRSQMRETIRVGNGNIANIARNIPDWAGEAPEIIYIYNTFIYIIYAYIIYIGKQRLNMNKQRKHNKNMMFILKVVNFSKYIIIISNFTLVAPMREVSLLRNIPCAWDPRSLLLIPNSPLHFSVLEWLYI